MLLTPAVKTRAVAAQHYGTTSYQLAKMGGIMPKVRLRVVRAGLCWCA